MFKAIYRFRLWLWHSVILEWYGVVPILGAIVLIVWLWIHIPSPPSPCDQFQVTLVSIIQNDPKDAVAVVKFYKEEC